MDITQEIKHLQQLAARYPPCGAGSERRYQLLAQAHILYEEQVRDERERRLHELIAGCGFVVGDRVQRKSTAGLATSHNPVGIITEIFVAEYDRERVKARVHWLDGQTRLGGGYDYHTTLRVSSLRKITATKTTAMTDEDRP